MKRSKKIALIVALAAAVILVRLIFLINNPRQQSRLSNIASRIINKLDRNSDSTNKTIQPGSGIVDLSVPFTAQSPLAHWNIPEEDSACEEASLVMAEHWLQGDPSSTLDPNAANAEIHAIIDFENKNYGNAIDTSAADTAATFRAYYSANNISVVNDISTPDIINVLTQGKLVIVPTNGNALGNPHFQNPGPETHMLVIRGYDNNTKEFIVNDPGTKFGENYKYSYDVLYNAIRDYPTGNHLPIVGNRKVMLVVTK